MAVVKGKIVKNKSKINEKSKNIDKTKLLAELENKSWSKVKIRGKVISDEGGAGLEGLLGLEVLESYDSSLVKKGKGKQSRKQKRMEKKKEIKKRKLVEATALDESPNGEECDTSEEDSDIEEPTVNIKKIVTSFDNKLAKRKEKREKRKEQRKQVANKNKGATNKKVKTLQDEDSDNNDEYPPDRFALVRPPPPIDDDDEINDEENNETAEVNLDNLEGWNGLGIPKLILQALAVNGFKKPTEIQALTLPAAILGKKDILGAAETGSGKTLAFGIPILAGILELKSKNIRYGIRKVGTLLNEKSNKETAHEPIQQKKANRELTPPPEELDYYPKPGNQDETDTEDIEDNDDDQEEQQDGPLYAVILTPTRELAVQIRDHIKAAAKFTGINIAAIFGGLSVEKQERLLRKCPEIVVATPGRFWELYTQGNKHLSKIENISFFVIDETDRMVEKGHFEELRSLLKVLNDDEDKKKIRQNFIFSATLTLVHDIPDHLQKRNTGKRPKYVKPTSDQKIQGLIEELGISQPKIVDITRKQQTAQNLTECRLICPIDHKDYYLYYFVQRHPGRTIVFCNSIDCVKRLTTLFDLLNCKPLPLHANMIQKQRLKNLERFRDNSDGFLIATDVAARGLDIPNVEHVIHYQVPRTSENYVHRSGRTARANKNGITVMFMEPGEVRNYVRLYKTLNRTEDLPLFPVFERYLPAVKERVSLAREVDKIELKNKRTQSEIGWMKKYAEEMEIVIDGYNDHSGSDEDEDPFIIERRRDKLHLDNTKNALKKLLSTQIFPKGFNYKYPGINDQTQITSTGGTSDNHSNSAVAVMKKAIEENNLAKKKRNKKKSN